MKQTNNKMKAILKILKSLNEDYNANNLSKILGITSMGALKILKNLEREHILKSNKMGNAFFYEVDFENEYALDYIEFLLKNEAELSNPYVKRWIRELKKINKADIIIIFGSVLKIGEEAKDIDVLFMVKKKNFNFLKLEIEKLNKINEKKIHPIYQTFWDLKSNLIKNDRIILNAIKGVAVKGENKFIDLIKDIK